MKRICILALAALLAGCSAGPAKETTTSAPAFQPKVSAVATSSASPSLAIISTPAPTEEVTPALSTNPTTVSTIPDFLQGEPDPGYKIGNAVISNADFIYYYKPGATFGDSYIIYKEDKKTGKTRKLRETEDNAGCMSIFLDGKGGLYYLSCGYTPMDDEDIAQGRLYKYDPDGDILISRNVYQAIRSDDNFVYYASQNFLTQKAAIFRYDIVSGKSTEILNFDGFFDTVFAVPYRNAVIYRRAYENANSSYNTDPQCYCLDLATGNKAAVFYPDESCPIDITDDGENVIQIVSNDSVDRAIITNYRTLTEKSVMIEMTQYIEHTIVIDDTLYVISSDEDWTHSVISAIDINSGKLLEITGNIGCVGYTQCDNGFWYILTNIYSGGSDLISQVKLSSFDLNSREIKTVKTCKCPQDSDGGPIFEIEAGGIWIISVYDCDASPCDLWKNFKIE